MSLINQTSRSNASLKPSSRRAETSRVYAHPLPIIFPEPTYKFLGLSLTRPLNPHCTALFDPLTRSAWVPSSGDATLLWQRGFFGKGDLSRSEPSWLARQINARKMKGKGMSFSCTAPNIILTLNLRSTHIRRDHRQTPCRAQAI